MQHSAAPVLPYTTPDWQTVRAKIGIDTSAVFDLEIHNGNILYGTYKGIEYPHLRGNTESEIYWNNITPSDVTTGEVLSTGSYNGTRKLLVIR